MSELWRRRESMVMNKEYKLAEYEIFNFCSFESGAWKIPCWDIWMIFDHFETRKPF
jgi:hypothetical protein